MAWPLGRILKYAVVGGLTAGTIVSLNTNQGQLNSIGVVRLARAASTVFDIGLIYRLELYKHGLDKGSEEYEQLKSRVHQLAAEKLLKLCCTNRGVYIKVGQHIAALEYLVPKEYSHTMRILHSHAPTNTLAEIYKVIREDLHHEPEEIFATFDEKPLGAASLAQVHRATLLDGTEVAVKVQHPYVRGNARVDMKTMEVLVKIMSWVFPEFQMQWLVDETKTNIPRELNFWEEGHNAEKIAEMFQNKPWLKIPKIHWSLTTPRVLTMDYLEGGQVNDVEYIKSHNIDPFEISDKLGQLYSQMIFVKGFVHSDPHPGNILVRKNERGSGIDVILLDHGLYATLSNEFRYNYSQLWLSILNVDRTAMRYHSEQMGIKGNMYGLFACMVTGRPWQSVVEGINKVKQTQTEKDLFQKELPNVLPQISDVLEKVNRQMLLIFKTNDLLRGIEYALKTNTRMTSFMVMSQCCINTVHDEHSRQARTRLEKFKIYITRHWSLFKLTLFYTYLSIKSFSLFSIVNSIKS